MSVTVPLYIWSFKEEGSTARVLVGADPAEPDKIYSWPNRPRGWDDRKPWAGGALTEPNVKAIPASVGQYSGWPGVKRQVGRPRKQSIDPAPASTMKERRTTLALSLSPAVYKKLMAVAGEQLYGDWVVATIRGDTPPVHEVVRVQAEDRASATGHVVVRLRVPVALMVAHQGAAGDAGMLLNAWLSAVVTYGVLAASGGSRG
jgi:hypothetical protein